MPNPFNSPPRGSLNWGADRIRRLLDREKRGRSAQSLPEKLESSYSRANRDLPTLPSELNDPVGATRQLLQDIQNAPILAGRVRLPTAHVQPAGHVRAAAPQGPNRALDARAEKPEDFEDYVSARAAISEMVGSQLPGRESGPADAYRHILSAGEITRRFGEDYARQLLNLHEFEGNVLGQSDEDNAMDTSNNEIGIQIGIGARTYGDVISAARKVISGSAPDGLAGWRPDYDPTSTLAPHAAQWLPETQWKNNPNFEVPRRYPFPPLRPQEMPTRPTNWYSNASRPDGPDWSGGYVPDGYVYNYSDRQHATRSWPLWWRLTGPR